MNSKVKLSYNLLKLVKRLRNKSKKIPLNLKNKKGGLLKRKSQKALMKFMKNSIMMTINKNQEMTYDLKLVVIQEEEK